MADDFVTPYANSVFEQPWWLDIVAPGKWGEVFVKEGSEVVGRMPYVLEKGRIVMPPYTQTLGPWIKPEYRSFQAGNAQLSRQKEIISALIDQLPAHKSFKMTFDSANEYILPYRWLGFRYTPQFSYRLCDLSDLDSVYSLFHKTAKKNIRRASGRTHVVVETDPNNVIGQMKKTFSNQKRGLPGGEKNIERIINGAIEHGNGKILTAFDDDGNVHASDFLLFDERICYDVMGGSDPEFRNSGAASLVFWEAIKSASQTSKAFDFEGSNIEGIENIFRQFGGERVINYAVTKQGFVADCMELAKPRIKKLLGYKN